MSPERKTNLADPTAERTSDQSTQTASGLSGGRGDAARGAADAPEHDREDEDRDRTPATRREAEDPALPADDASLKTNI